MKGSFIFLITLFIGLSVNAQDTGGQSHDGHDHSVQDHSGHDHEEGEFDQNLTGDSCPCCASDFMDFDFLVGNWKITDSTGNVIGTSKVSKANDNCVIVETVEHYEGGYKAYAMRYFDRKAETWRMVWMDNAGYSNDLVGRSNSRGMVMYTLPEEPGETSEEVVQKLIVISIAKDNVGNLDCEWKITVSDEDDPAIQNWKVLFRGKYLLVEEEGNNEEMDPQVKGRKNNRN